MNNLTPLIVLSNEGHFKHTLRLALPAGSKELDEINYDDYDLAVPDAVIDLDLDILIMAIKTLGANPEAFVHIGAKAHVVSEKFEGKLRHAHLNICVYGDYRDPGFSFYLEFCNANTGSPYFLNMTPYIYRLLGDFDDMFDALQQLLR